MKTDHATLADLLAAIQPRKKRLGWRGAVSRAGSLAVRVVAAYGLFVVLALMSDGWR